MKLSCKIFSLFGLALGISGSGILFCYSNPQPTFIQGSYLAVEDNTPIDDKGTTAKENDLKIQKEKRNYIYKSRLGFALLILGFIFQGIPLFINEEKAAKIRKKAKNQIKIKKSHRKLLKRNE